MPTLDFRSPFDYRLDGLDDRLNALHWSSKYTYKYILPYTTTDQAICPGSKGLFVPVLEPGQGRRDKSAGGFCPGW